MALALSVVSAESATYTVVPGDRLVDIADRLGVAPRDLVLANNLADAELLRPGQSLLVPTGEAPRPAPSTRGNRTETASAPTVWVWPTTGRITTRFKELGSLWRRGFHPGLDIGAPMGTPIVAAADGVVIEAEPEGWNSGYGSYVKLDHGGGMHTLYGHMSRVQVVVGDEVAVGGRLGLVGSTGHSTGPHLHMEVRINGEIQDPEAFLP